MQWTPTSSPNRTANRVKIDITTYAPNLLIKFGAYAFIYAPIDSAERRLRQGAETTVFILRKHTKKRTCRCSRFLLLCAGKIGLAPLLLDACFLASKATEIVEASTANFADAVNDYLLNERRVHREDTLNTDTARNLADSESLTCALTLNLDDDTLVNLNTLLVTLLNLVGDRNSVTRLESWQLDAGLESVLSNFD